MPKVKDLFPVNLFEGCVGFEIEVEGENLPEQAPISKYWRKDIDSSLRGESAEYVLKEPVDKETFYKAFKVLTDAIKMNKSTIRKTYRAGTHVHINTQDMSVVQLMNFIFLYLILEEVLINYCDKTRVGNHFCLRMSDASYLEQILIDFIRTGNVASLNNEDIRYASINLTSLHKYGSVEFRALESTFDFEKVMVWVSTLTRLKEFAKTVANPVDLLGSVSERGYKPFVQQVLGDLYRHYHNPDIENQVKIGVRNTQYSIYSRNWDLVDYNIFKKKCIFNP